LRQPFGKPRIATFSNRSFCGNFVDSFTAGGWAFP